MLYETSGTIYETQKALIGMTMTMDGIISATGNIFTFIILNPVASIINPPHALKSAIMVLFVIGIISSAQKKRIRKIINCGILSVY